MTPSPRDEVAATLSLAEAEGTRWDAIVVGAGPAGGSLAIRLATHGRRVLLVDRERMPRPKVCGCCLSDVAVAELSSIGLAAADLGAAPRDRVRIVTPLSSIVLPLGGLTLSREALDTAIVRRAIAAGSSWLPGLTVSSIQDGPTSVTITARDADGQTGTLRASHAIVATGLADRVRVLSENDAHPKHRATVRGSRIGVGATLPGGAMELDDRELVMAVADTGYCGIVRLEDGRIDLAAAIDASVLRRHRTVSSAIAPLLAGMPSLRLREGAVEACFRGTPALTHRSPTVAGRWKRVYRVGDAAAYVEPFTGEGIGWALAGSRALADAMLATDSTDAPDATDTTDGARSAAADAFSVASTIATSYHRGEERQLGRSRSRCRAVAWALRRPWLVRAAMATAHVSPRTAAWAVPLVVGAGTSPGGTRP